MAFLRWAASAVCVIVFPIAAWLAVNAAVLQDNYADGIDKTVDNAFESGDLDPFVRQAAADWIEAEPDIGDDLGSAVLVEALTWMSRTEAAEIEIRRGTAEFTDGIRAGDVPPVTLDFRPALEEARPNLDSAVYDALVVRDLTVSASTHGVDAELTSFFAGVQRTSRVSAVLALAAAVLLLLLRGRPRAHFGALFWVGLPLVAIEFLILRALRGAADGQAETTIVDELVGSWTPVVVAMLAVTIVSGGIFFAWKRVLPEKLPEESAAPWLPGPAQDPPTTGPVDYIYRGE